jgi:hypothetical protein
MKINNNFYKKDIYKFKFRLIYYIIVGSVVRVGTNRMSDHLPISANITV